MTVYFKPVQRLNMTMVSETKLILNTDEQFAATPDHDADCSCYTCCKNRRDQFNRQIPVGWASDDGNKFRSVSRIEKTLPPGVYKFVQIQGVPFFYPIKFQSDIPLDLPGLPSHYILDQIKTFWKKAEEYKKYGLIHKRGILMYGPPGCGKTCIIRLLSDHIIALGGIVFCIESFEDAGHFVRTFRNAEPERPILTIQEDVENVLRGDDRADEIKAALSFLDGQDQVNNIVHVATTNEPELLADRFIKRPGRYDLIIGVHPPSKETREAYLKAVCKNEIPQAALVEIVDKTEGLGLSYLRELVASHLCLNISIDETLKRLRANFNAKKLGDSKTQVGFTVGWRE